jgi:hypothetical protein
MQGKCINLGVYEHINKFTAQTLGLAEGGGWGEWDIQHEGVGERVILKWCLWESRWNVVAYSQMAL